MKKLLTLISSANNSRYKQLNKTPPKIKMQPSFHLCKNINLTFSLNDSNDCIHYSVFNFEIIKITYSVYLDFDNWLIIRSECGITV